MSPTDRSMPPHSPAACTRRPRGTAAGSRVGRAAPRLGAFFSSAVFALAPVVAAVFALASTAAHATGPAPASAPPVVLTNADVGKTAEQIPGLGAATAPDAVSVAPPEASAPPGPSEADALVAAAEQANRAAREAAAHAEATRRAAAAAEAGLIPGIGPNRDGPAGYESCLETAIRRGDAYAAADRMCRVVFPSSTQ